MAVAYVSAQSGFNSGGSPVSTLTVTVGTAVAPGSAVCIMVGGLPSAGNISGYSITDNGSGATYHAVTNCNDGAGYFAAFFYAVNVQGSPTQFVIHAGTGTINFPAMLLDTFSGVSAVSPAIDGSSSQTLFAPGTGTNAISSGNFSPATSGDLIWGATVDEGSFGGDVVGTGFTQGQNQASSFVSAYKLSGVTGSQAVTFTNATSGGSAGAPWLTGGFALKAAVPTTLSPPQKQWQWVGNAPSLTSNTNLPTVQKAWQWVANAPTIAIGLLLLPPQKAWAWLANTPALNTALQTVQKAWAWIPHAPTISQGLQTVQKAWVWFAQAPTLIPSTIINPPKALWAWVARAPVLSGGNIPGHIRHGFNVMRGVMWGVLSGIDRGEMR